MIIIFFLSWVLLFSRYSCLPASQQSPEPFDNKDTVWHPQLPTSDTAKSTAVALLTSLPQPRKPTSVSLISLGSGFRIPTERPSTWHKPTGPKNTRTSSTGTTFAAAGPTRPNVPVALTFPKDTGTVKSSRTATLNSGRQTSQTLPFAVISTTVSDEPYALTFVPTQASAGTEVVESGSKLTTKTVPAGGESTHSPESESKNKMSTNTQDRMVLDNPKAAWWISPSCTNTSSSSYTARR